MREDLLPRLSKRAFLFIVPTMRVEVACAVTVVAAFAASTAEDSFFSGFVEVLSEGWHKGEYVMCAIFPLMVLAVACGLLLPWVDLVAHRRIPRRLRVLTVLASAFVIVCVLGWSATEQLGAAEGNRWVQGILAVVAFIEFAVVGFGVVELLGDRQSLDAFLRAGKVDWVLFGVVMCAVAATLTLHIVADVMSPGTVALSALNIAFVAASLRKGQAAGTPSSPGSGNGDTACGG